jgi:hypothetical protein
MFSYNCIGLREHQLKTGLQNKLEQEKKGTVIFICKFVQFIDDTDKVFAVY